jgi:hypothetical protein
MSTQNRLNALLKNKLAMIEYASSRIKAQYRYNKMYKSKQNIKNNLPKLQRTIKNFLIKAKLFRKKTAVLKI